MRAKKIETWRGVESRVRKPLSSFRIYPVPPLCTTLHRFTMSLDALAREIVTNSVETTLYSLTDHCPPIVDLIHDYAGSLNVRRHFQTVLQDLVRVTHCHGCGRKRNVCFFGYVRQYCGKRCYEASQLYTDDYEYDSETDELILIPNENPYYDYDSRDYDPDDTDYLPHSAFPCKWCDEETRGLSRANGLYHRQYYAEKYPGMHWPMCAYDVPCHNECIRDRPVIRIRGYNYH